MQISKPSAPGNALTLIERQIRRWDRIAATLKKSTEATRLAKASHRPVMTVSGPIGGGREPLAVSLCKEFDYALFGREILDEVASDLNCQRMLLESLDERARSNIVVMFESWIHGREIENQEYIGALFRVMESLAAKGGVVIMGRGGAFILEERAALRICVTAPLDIRLQRVMKGWEIGEEEARRLIRKRDREQEEFTRQCFRREIGDPLGFDLSINTARFDLGRLTGLVRAALAERGIEIHKPPVEAV